MAKGHNRRADKAQREARENAGGMPVKTPRGEGTRGPHLKPIFITPRDIKRAAEVGNTNEDIAILAGLSTSALEARFSEELVQGRSLRRQTILSLQYQLMEKSDKTMLIWLGKNGVGQADRSENEEVNFDLNTLSTEELASYASGHPLKKILAARVTAA